MKVKSEGSFAKTDKFLSSIKADDIYSNLDLFGQEGVDLLRVATPVETGRAAGAWSYTVDSKHGRHKITWHNSDIEGGPPVVMLIQYGHATGTGGYVPGRDFINPALKPLFDRINQLVWEKVTNA